MSRLCPDGDLPVVCSVCLQSPAAHNPKIRYVNFESAYDGPVVKDPERPADEPGVYIEKVVICENCVREGAALLGLEDGAKQNDRIEAWKGYAESVESEVADKDKAIANLAYTVGVLLDSPVKRKVGRPQLTGPESHEEQIKEMRSTQAKKERVRKKVSNGN
jgi:hypothetical protein